MLGMLGLEQGLPSYGAVSGNTPSCHWIEEKKLLWTRVELEWVQRKVGTLTGPVGSFFFKSSYRVCPLHVSQPIFSSEVLQESPSM